MRHSGSSFILSPYSATRAALLGGQRKTFIVSDGYWRLDMDLGQGEAHHAIWEHFGFHSYFQLLLRVKNVIVSLNEMLFSSC